MENISYSDIYDGLWKCRDFELAHCWQRSIFLTAFLMACYAGYGGFVLTCATAETIHLPFIVANGIALAISTIGLALSLMWIMMAKGSKAWYEHYESAINAFVARYEDNENVFQEDVSTVAGFRIANAAEFKKCDVSSWLWNTRGGSYSVSKINVAIGHLSAVVWAVLICIHVGISGMESGLTQAMERVHGVLSDPALIGASVLLVFLAFWVYARMQLKSSYFGND